MVSAKSLEIIPFQLENISSEEAIALNIGRAKCDGVWRTTFLMMLLNGNIDALRSRLKDQSSKTTPQSTPQPLCSEHSLSL
jgi:hypothetical protein